MRSAITIGMQHPFCVVIPSEDPRGRYEPPYSMLSRWKAQGICVWLSACNKTCLFQNKMAYIAHVPEPWLCTSTEEGSRMHRLAVHLAILAVAIMFGLTTFAQEAPPAPPAPAPAPTAAPAPAPAPSTGEMKQPGEKGMQSDKHRGRAERKAEREKRRAERKAEKEKRKAEKKAKKHGHEKDKGEDKEGDQDKKDRKD